MRTLKDLAEEVYRVQDACNLSGVLLGASRAIKDLRAIAESQGHSWEWVDRHPIMQLWADKITHLTGTQTLGNDAVGKAYGEIYEISRFGRVSSCQNKLS